MRPRTPVLTRFERSYVGEPNSGCWLWTRTWYSGYGRIFVDGRDVRAHRLSWEIHYGPIPDGLCVLHKCDVPPCVNPKHLFLGTDADNVADKVAKKRHTFGVTQPAAVLTDAAVVAIMKDRRPTKQIARDHGVNVSTIRCIKKGRSWTHVTHGVSEAELGSIAYQFAAQRDAIAEAVLKAQDEAVRS